MDPYKTPETNVEKEVGEKPRDINIAHAIIALSFLIFLIGEIIYAATSETGLHDPYNYIFVPIWGVMLFLMGSLMKKSKNNPRYTFLALAIVFTGASIYDPAGPYSLYVNFAESLCFLSVFLLLSKKELKGWFN